MSGLLQRQPAAVVAGAAPYRWPPLRAYNALARRVPRLAVQVGDPEELVTAARAQTGLHDLGGDPVGSPAWAEGLTQFVAALRSEAGLTPAGRFFARGAILAALANRLHAEQSFAADPVIVTRPVGPAIVVVGLPRSGTTLLQNLLALDPDNRSLRQWEASTPAPPPAVDAEQTDDRPRQAERSTRLLDRIAPAARTLHPTGPRLPTECVTLFANSFASLEFGVIYQVPSYLRWCLDTDMAPHYDYYARQLQLLGRHDQRDRWSLKSPAHLFWMDELLRVLPQARVVQLHRDPLQVLGSFCSLAAVLNATNAGRVDTASIGALWSAAWAEGVARAEGVRAHVADDRWLDVRYDRLVADPAATIGDIYAAFGHPFTASFAAAIRAHVATHPQHGGGRHRYALADFGLDDDRERARFAAAGPARWRAAEVAS